MENPLIPLLSKSLGSQELQQHRAMIAVELEVLAKTFDRFGWDRDRGTASHDRIVTDWMDALQDYPLAEVQAACAAAVKENPNKQPNHGHIKDHIQRERARKLALLPKQREPEVKRWIDKDGAAEILDRAGFSRDRIAAIQKAPRIAGPSEIEPTEKPRRRLLGAPTTAQIEAVREKNKMIQESRMAIKGEVR